MPALNTAELTALHTETLTEARRARTYANITRRAETLFQDGYNALSVGHGGYCIFTPEGGTYAVFISDTPDCEIFGSRCSCPAFAEYGTCKHFQAVEMMLRDEAQAAEHDALMSGAETGIGCDAYAEF